MTSLYSGIKIIMKCMKCKEELSNNPIKQGNEFFCSLECANLAAGYEPDEELSYFEEEEISKDLYNDFEE